LTGLLPVDRLIGRVEGSYIKIAKFFTGRPPFRAKSLNSSRAASSGEFKFKMSLLKNFHEISGLKEKEK